MTDRKRPCKFPFIYQEKTYNVCTKAGEMKTFWCATEVIRLLWCRYVDCDHCKLILSIIYQVDSAGKALVGNWGNCLDGCPTGNSTDNSTSPWDFAALCETGQCPTGWNTEEESCDLNMEDLEKTAARERCGKYRGKFSTATKGRYQCKG